MMDWIDLQTGFDRIVEGSCDPATVRAIESGASPAALWDRVTQSGYLDALVAEADGGAGLPLAAVAPMIETLGRTAMPLPVGETMFARAVLRADGIPAPDGPIALAVADEVGGAFVPFGRVADHVLLEARGAIRLLSAASATSEGTGVYGSLALHMMWNEPSEGPVVMGAAETGIRPVAALIRAALIAGAADHVVELTATYANDRVQFGRPVGRQQALQQSMAVMAEEAIAARFAARLGFSSAAPTIEGAALAKSVASRAAVRIAATAHAVHGAIGISAEHDLQLFTRRLHEWRLADGSETFWERLLGRAQLNSTANGLDFIRQNLVW